jgi:hypothetical protein
MYTLGLYTLGAHEVFLRRHLYLRGMYPRRSMSFVPMIVGGVFFRKYLYLRGSACLRRTKVHKEGCVPLEERVH